MSYLSRRSPTGLQLRRNRTLVVHVKLGNRLKAQAGFCPPGFRKELLEDNIWFVTQPCGSRDTQGSISHHPSGGPLKFIVLQEFSKTHNRGLNHSSI